MKLMGIKRSNILTPFLIIAALAYSLAATFDQDVLAASLTSPTGIRILGETVNTGFGATVSCAGDVNGDKIKDLIIGAPIVGIGVAYVLFGRPGIRINTDFDVLADLTALPGSGFRIVGASSGSKTGQAVSSAGDINHDGLDDILVSAVGTSSAGVVYVIFGRDPAVGPSSFADINLANGLSNSDGFSILGAAGNDNSGCSVARAGDVNGDGVDDIIIGAYGADPPALAAASNAGIAYVIFGRDVENTGIPFVNFNLATIDASVGFRILGAAANDNCGRSVAGIGDVNGDNVDDVLVGAPGVNGSGGAAYVIFGQKIIPGGSPLGDVSIISMPSTVGFRIFGAAGGDALGGAVNSVGDINGDGVQDIIVAAKTAEPAGLVATYNCGITYVLYGQSAQAAAYIDINVGTLASTPTVGFRIIGAAQGDQSGNAVSSAGDVNGDGVDDLIIGANSAEIVVTNANSGIAYVIFGRKGVAPFGDVQLTTIVTGSLDGFRVGGAVGADQLGWAVSSAGDIDGDGGADIIIGASYADPPNAGATSRNNAGIAYVIFGTPYAPSSQPSSQPSRQPSSQPSVQPSRHPTSQPSAQPRGVPTAQPSGRPSTQPSSQPSVIPSAQPSAQPSMQPSAQPVASPSSLPSSHPSAMPSCPPSTQPTAVPSVQPSSRPSVQPSIQPSTQPSLQPSNSPSSQPSPVPTQQPTVQPTEAPTNRPSVQPTSLPSTQPSTSPSREPSSQPTVVPSSQPTRQPSRRPSSQPSTQPSSRPSVQPSSEPSVQPSCRPTARPSAQPSWVPSNQPSAVPSTQPFALPTRRPSGLPSSQPSSRPSAEPSSWPTTQPSRQPTSRPSSQSSSVPSYQPSAQPTSLPTAQPLLRPSAMPSNQPSCQPTHQPSAGPSAQPSTQPSSHPSIHPSASPTTQPSVRPSSQPSLQPSAQPTQQPLALPTAQPSVQPSTQPSAAPTDAPLSAPSGEWETVVSGGMIVRTVAQVADSVWSCGERMSSNEAECILMSKDTGEIITQYEFGWDRTVSAFTTSAGAVMLAGWRVSAFSTTSEVAKCAMIEGQLKCAVKSFADTMFQAATYVPYPNRIVTVGMYNVYVSATITDILSDTVRSFIYTLFNMRSVVLLQVQSPPNFIGSFVAGTAVRSAGSPVNIIIAGMLRTDNGVLSALSLVPVEGDILNSADIVTSTALEVTGPDLFIAGGLQLSDGAGANAYILRTNALYSTVMYCVRLRLSQQAHHEHRMLLGSVASRTVARGVVIMNNDLFVILDHTRTNITSLTAVKLNAATGAIVKQVHLTVKNASLHCTDMTATGFFLAIVCNVHPEAANTQYSVTITVDFEFSLKVLPPGFHRSDSAVFTAEAVPFQRSIVAVAARANTIAYSASEFNTADQAPSRRPSAAPSSQPSAQPSSAPSTQPRSSPTAAPTVSARPTSVPSTASPTNTHKPSAAPTAAPTTVPSVVKTQRPTPYPSAQPSARPTIPPSARPSAAPTVTPSVRVSHSPTAKPSRAPTTRPTARPTLAFTAAPSTGDDSLASSHSGDGRKRSTVIGASVGGAIFVCLCGYLLFQHRKNAAEEEAKAKRKVEYFRRQELLVAAMEKEREEMMRQIAQEDEQKRQRKEQRIAKRSVKEGLYSNSGANAELLTTRDLRDSPVQSEPHAASSEESFSISSSFSSEQYSLPSTQGTDNSLSGDSVIYSEEYDSGNSATHSSVCSALVNDMIPSSSDDDSQFSD